MGEWINEWMDVKCEVWGVSREKLVEERSNRPVIVSLVPFSLGGTCMATA